MSRSAKIVILVAAVLGAAAVLGYVAPARLFMLKALGRSPHCPMPNALEARNNLTLQIRYKDEILAASRLLEKEIGRAHV